MKIHLIILLSLFVFSFADTDICVSTGSTSFQCTCENPLSKIICTNSDSAIIKKTDTVWSFFKAKANVEDLEFTKNFDYIPNNIFNDFLQLKIFKITATKLSKLESNDFLNLKYLQEIDLSNNKIVTIAKNSFNQLPALKKIYLNNNLINSIDSDAFGSLPELEELYLHTNKLVNLPIGVFNQMPMLKILALHNNQLVEFKRELLVSIISNFKMMDSRLWLLVNNLQCSCDLIWLYDFYKTTHSERTKYYLSNLNCYADLNNMGIGRYRLFEMNPIDICPTYTGIFDPLDNHFDFNKQSSMFNNIHNPTIYNPSIVLNFYYLPKTPTNKE